MGPHLSVFVEEYFLPKILSERMEDDTDNVWKLSCLLHLYSECNTINKCKVI